MENNVELTPRQVVAELDKYIIGQDEAKRAVAIAVRNRWRRQQLPDDIRDEVAPKNIIMVGPTGVGKTEIARRLAALMNAPFIKIEATKFTEVGYVGRDVDSIVRDLLERAIHILRAEQAQIYEAAARNAAEERLLDALLPLPMTTAVHTSDEAEQEAQRHQRTREKLRQQLQAGSLEDRKVEINVEEKAMPVNIFSNIGLEQMEPEMQNFFERIMPTRTARRRASVAEARQVLFQQELDKFIDQDMLLAEAIARTEQSGIVFLDEIDKICGGEAHGPDVSREGVQRDLLPLVEGTTVNTRHGMVRTDHILFIGAGAFSRNKPSDLMPELQGRFPIRVQLKDLSEEDFVRILTEPHNALTRQQTALLATDGVELTFTDEGVKALAAKAFELNNTQQNIGARRLYAVMEKVCEQISYDAPDAGEKKVIVDAAFVADRLAHASRDEDLNIFGFARGQKPS